MRFEQDDVVHHLMLKLLERNGDQYFQCMTSRGYKLPPSYDTHQIVQESVPTKLEIPREELQ